MTLFNDDEVAVYEARINLNCVLKQEEELAKEYHEKMAKLDLIVTERRKILQECLDKLPEVNVYNK